MPAVDYYELLGVDARATSDEIKAAYHRTLLAHHPDKLQSPSTASAMDFAQLKEAYSTLSSPALRRAYDDSRREAGTRQQRPAEVVSLDEFVESSEGEWRYPCRCGREFVLREGDLERGVHLIGCDGCSELIWAGYEPAQD
ncbi:DnaJ-domain-containing protein [Exidia glandulosa HHB12029]|uniref:Diphthamide biosynthesis protein 4 n=1 Tax=Exidia glandulosa HHB12029 TaxID=1314781 RepID=A0A165QA98_EXIGL|nr:DnaJ-domain-containing protein [Exidia glandulosa HHB12029]